MSAQDSTNNDDLQLDEDIELYLNIALSNGFSKGTANVSGRDMKKLKGLLAHYAKKKKPFTACYNDQIKHGLSSEHAKKRCAVLKDLIRGTTKWRGKENMSDDEKAEFILDDYPADDNYIEEFVDWALNLDDETVNMILTSNNNDDSESDMTEIDSQGDVTWTQSGSFNNLKQQIELALNKDSEFGCEYWVNDMQADKALVCEKGKTHYVVPFSVSKKGTVELEDEDNWIVVAPENVTLSDDNKEMVAELFFSDAGAEVDSDGLVWKTFLREGTWAYSPGTGTKLKKPLTITKSGKSDPEKLVISMAELKRNFDAGVIQHVTVPLSHDDKPHENTGFVKKLRYGKDVEGRTTLEAALSFTEPDIKGKIDRGTIPNVSGGIHFNYIDKEKGRKFTSALGHIALTPKPWLQGMAPFGVNASENLNVVGFSEEPLTSENIMDEGGVEDNMTTIVEETDNTDTFLSELGLSEDEVKARLSRYEELERESKENRIDEQVRTWESEKKAPAVVAAAKEILMADEGSVVLNLSDDGKDVSLTASDIVERLVAASPELNLTDEVITEEDTAGEAPADDATEENLSEAVKSEARRLFLYENYSEDDALAEAIKRNPSQETA
jgi:hypothetical protein